MRSSIERFSHDEIIYSKLLNIFHGWRAHAKWSDSNNVKNKITVEIVSTIWNNA